MSEAFLTALLLGAVTASVPLLLAGLGEQVSEKAGVLNIGMEGMMLAGAYCGFVADYHSGSASAGFAAGAACGMAVALVMAVLCVGLGLNQIVIGIALTLGAQGLTALLYHVQFAALYPRLADVGVVPIPLLSRLPVVGAVFFARPLVVYLAWLSVPLAVHVFRSRLGLCLQAAGDRPAALDAAGVPVMVVRAGAVLTAGFFAGIGGAFLAIVGAGIFVPFMTNGAGFIGIVLAMLARGRPWLVLAGAMLFGACVSAATALQVAGVDVPTDVIQMLPFAAVLLALVIFGRGAGLPASLGVHYVRGAR